MSTDTAGSESGESRPPYVESPIIMTTVRVITPFIFTFGLFVMFHGADSSGGGFQGGVIVGTVVLMLGIAFGIQTTRDWIGPQVPIAMISLGVLAFLATGIGSVLLGGGFLEYDVYNVPKASKYGIEFVELAIGLVVSGIVTGLFLALASGIQTNGRDTE
jgi:multicomponent Na+:H+ antiporter subunit B